MSELCEYQSSLSVQRVRKYGRRLTATAFWNSFGRYGSSFSEYSPWNSFTDKAPIIVDRDGKSYGYFSVNAFHHDRTQIKLLIAVLDFYDDKGDLDETKEKLCTD